MFQVLIYEEAKDDILRNAKWWSENRSMDQAILWIEAIEMQLWELSKEPERHGIAPESHLFHYELRQVLIGHGNRRSFRAVFTVRNQTVHVLTIRRAEQDAISPTDLPAIR